jgi:hypothetical protein
MQDFRYPSLASLQDIYVGERNNANVQMSKEEIMVKEMQVNRQKMEEMSN